MFENFRKVIWYTGTWYDSTKNTKVVVYLKKSFLGEVFCIFLNLFGTTDGLLILSSGSIILLTMLVCLGYTLEILLICVCVVTVKIIAYLITKQIEEIDWDTYRTLIRAKNQNLEEKKEVIRKL